MKFVLSDGSAFAPSSVITRPLTLTWPCAIISSAARRDEMPAFAMIFCSRSSIRVYRVCRV